MDKNRQKKSKNDYCDYITIQNLIRIIDRQQKKISKEEEKTLINQMRSNLTDEKKRNQIRDFFWFQASKAAIYISCKYSKRTDFSHLDLFMALCSKPINEIIDGFNTNLNIRFFTFANHALKKRAITEACKLSQKIHKGGCSPQYNAKEIFSWTTDYAEDNIGLVELEREQIMPYDRLLEQGDLVERDLLRKSILKKLKGLLSENEYSDIENHYFKELSYAEISELQGRSYKSVDNSLLRARKKIKKLIPPSDFILKNK